LLVAETTALVVAETTLPTRQPWIAVVLSLLCTGLGQIYCGRTARGLVLFLAVLLFAPVVVLAALLQPNALVLVGLLLVLVAVLGVMLFSAIDAYRVARAFPADGRLSEPLPRFLFVLFILVGVTYPVGIVVTLRANVFEAFYVPTGSEVPNILPGDRILVNKWVLRGEVPQRGDTVVFRNPRDWRQNYIKRVIALPGDLVAVRGGEVVLNGKKLEWERVPAESLSAIRDALKEGEVFCEVNSGRRYLVLRGPEKSVDFAEQRVPEGTCFVLGDNRNNSQDSRHFGCVPLGEVIGMPQYIYFPAESWSRFGASPK
jgi:signal peptidase I